MVSPRTLVELVKPRITIASSFTTILGWFLAGGALEWKLALLLLGIFLMACGSAALNQIQEAAIDAGVPRTARRPIPSGRISPAGALVFSLGLMAGGAAILIPLFPPGVVLAGSAAALIYNGIYTPLKRISPFAVLPGALIGAVPPLAGWLAAGGSALDPGVHQLCLFFFVWQVPHFWLLLLFHEANFRASGLPNLFDRFSVPQIRRLTFVWIAATAVSGVCTPLFGIVRHPATGLAIAAAALLLVFRATALLRPESAAIQGDARPLRPYRVRFMEINAYALWVLVALLIDRA